MTRIDSHCHFWDPGRGDYHWLDTGPARLDPLRRIFTPDDLARLNGKRQVVLVQAADSVAESHYMLSLAGKHPQILGVVGWVDVSDLASIDDLKDLARNPRFKGIRPMLQDLAEDDWILSKTKPQVIRAVQDLGLRFDGLVLTRHLSHFLPFVQAWPDLPMIIDHCAKPQMHDGLDPAWVKGMTALAALPHVHCKLSGLLTELPASHLDPDTAFATIRPAFDTVLRLFGPDRLVWGSDWPVLTLAAPHEVWEQMTDRLLEGLTDSERTAILGGNAIRFYGLEKDIR
jgi:L-fuconolactonase